MPEHATRDFGCAPRGKSVALPVLPADAPADKRKIRASRSGPWRAAVLILVHVLIAAHIVQWIVSGMRDGVRSTLTPVEPSESMYTLEKGLVNAGFVMFLLAIVSTLILGRFFCGWACHVVALQDLCSWVMRKCGVHPKPFRSRLLIFVPLGLALYMFVWPTLEREALKPLLTWLQIAWPVWLGPVGPRPGFQSAFMTENFWATFPPWYVAIPFLGICGFACVYFLGSKGFCSYGCPYGGFFGPADTISVGRIVVNDKCEGCGHCTAVCTSNVRVHEEVRDFGMVVDPGCMKCMDCVSVCPNEALSFGFAKPAVLAKPRTGASRTPLLKARVYDLTWREEIAVAAAFLALLVAFRGMFNLVPLLMAVGMAAIGAFCVWKLWQLLTVQNVRLQSLQLKYRGRLKTSGWILAIATTLMLALAAWAGVVRWHLWQANIADSLVKVAATDVFSPGYTPEPAVKARAQRAIELYERSGWRAEPVGASGIGWPRSPEVHLRLSWLWAVAGDLARAQAYLERALDQRAPAREGLLDLQRIMALRGSGPADVIGAFRGLVERWPDLDAARLASAQLELQFGSPDRAIDDVEPIVTRPVTRASVLTAAAEILTLAGDPVRALEVLDRARTQGGDPLIEPAAKEAATALAYLMKDDGLRAAEAMRKAVELEPENPLYLARLAEILRALGGAENTAEAARLQARATELERSAPPGSSAPGR